MPRARPEWIADHDDQAIPGEVKERVARRANGRCQGPCRRRLTPKDRPEIDHAIALCNGGEHRERNLRLVCAWCHGAKTKSDIAKKVKGARIYRRHWGFKPPSPRPVPGSRNTPYAVRYDRERGGFRTVRR